MLDGGICASFVFQGMVNPVTTARRQLSEFLQRQPWVIFPLRKLYRLTRPKFSAGAVGVVFNVQKQVLLVEHVFHPHAPWGLPGGWVDRGEDPAETVVREMREELGLEVKVIHVLAVEIEHRDHVDTAFLCTTKGEVGELSSELLDYRWYDIDALPEMYAFQRRAITLAARFVL